MDFPDSFRAQFVAVMKAKFCYIPENLDLDDLVEKNPPEFRPFKLDKLRYILSLLSELPSFRESNRGDSDYVPLNSTQLQKQGIKKYAKYIKYLKSLGIIKSDGTYTTGEKSLGYCLTKKYETKLLEVEITDSRFLKSLDNHHNKKKTSNESYLFLEHSVDGLEIDQERALKWLDEQRKINPEYKQTKKYRSAQVGIQKINKMDFFYSVDKTAGRFHSNLTNIPKGIRPFITWKGQQLVEIDLVNSQPAISTMLFNPSFYYHNPNGLISIYDTNESRCNRIINILNNQVDIINKKNKRKKKKIRAKAKRVRRSKYKRIINQINQKQILLFPTRTRNIINSLSIMLAVSRDLMLAVLSDLMLAVRSISSRALYHRKVELKTLRGLLMDFATEPDIRSYIKTARDGKFYEEVGDLVLGEKDRDKAKKMMFSVLFSKNHRKSIKKTKFNDHFPTVAKLFQLIKSKKHSDLACLLQNIESELIIKRIATRFNKENPCAPILTIHDSVITTQEYHEALLKIMEEECKRGLGFVPKLTTERWQP